MSEAEGSLLGGLGVLLAPDDPDAELNSFLTEWSTFFQDTEVLDPGQLFTMLSKMSHYLSSPNRTEELELVEAASDNPLLGVTLVLHALPTILVREPLRIWKLIFSEQTAQGFSEGWNIKDDLPAPRKGVNAQDPGIKYLIISDLHRDALSDDVGNLETGSIDHFKANRALYERVLDYAQTEGYILIEGGDCEELWFVRSTVDYPRTPEGALDIAAKLREIIVESHPGVYSRLRDLHRSGRYYRIYGNHDSFLKPALKLDGTTDNSVFEVLRAEMEKDGGPPFQIYDAFVIPGIKSMMEHTAFDIVKDAVKLATGELTAAQFAAKVLQGRLGMDSNDYAVDTKMLVTHGHQFDIWNCPENQILGLLNANGVGMFIDRNMDPFLDVRGIALQGNPYIDFADAFASWPLFNSFPAREPSVRFAHQVQHMPNLDRELMDSIMFSETRATLIGSFGIALKGADQNGVIRTPQESKAALCNNQIGLDEYLRRHHLHHLCIGHTHNPHSQPYATIKNLGTLALPLAPVLSLIHAILPIQPHLKTTYFNSGTAGWMEGVIWAIEIDNTGQARLVYWTDNSIGPEYMDWELKPLDTSVDNRLLEWLEETMGVDLDEISTDLEQLREMLKQRFQQLAVSAADIAAALGSAAIWPIHTLAAALVPDAALAPAEEPNERSESRLYQLQDVVPQFIQEKVDELKEQFERLRDFSYDAILTAKRRALGCDGATSYRETLTLKAPISESERERLERYQRVFIQMGAEQDAALHYAGVALSALGQFPRNVPFFSTLLRPLDPMGLLQAIESPVLYGLLSTLWMYPPAGQVVEVSGVPISSEFVVADGEVSLTVTIGAAPVIS